MKKKLLAVLLVMVLAIPMIAFANEMPVNRPVPNLDPATNYRETPQIAVVFMDGQSYGTLASLTLWKNGKTFLPVREVVEKMGLHIHYVADTRSIYIMDSANATHTATAERAAEGSFNLFRNNQKFNAKFEIVNNLSYVTAADFANALGLYYYEDVRTNSVYYFSGDAEMKDGEYTAASLNSRGWVPQVDITVEGGKIVAATYNEYHMEDGRGKKTDDTYKNNWKSREGYENAPDLADVIDQIEAELLAKQNPALVDAVTGATSACNSFKALTKKAMAKAMYAKATEGKSVDTYRDGTYKIIGLTDSRGWTSQVDMVIEDGKIVSVYYDSLNAAGDGKKDDADGYLTNWKSRYEGVDPVALITESETQLLKTQDPNLVDVATGATGWSNDLKRYVAGALYQAAKADVEVNEDSIIYIFMGDSTAHSAYFVQLLAIAENNEVKALDYVEFQRGNPLAKQHNEAYIGVEGNWWKNYNEAQLKGRMPLAVLEEMITYSMEHKVYENNVDVISGATNWGKGLNQLVPRVFDYIK